MAALSQRRGREAAAVEPPYMQQLKSVEQRAREAWLVHRACGHGIRHRVFIGICMCVCAIDKPRRAGELALGILTRLTSQQADDRQRVQLHDL